MLQSFLNKISDKSAIIGVVGLGYVGLPLATVFADVGFNVIGFEVDASKVKMLLEENKSYLDHLPYERIAQHIKTKRILPTLNFGHVSNCSAIIICVPTPLNKSREPDLSYIENVAYAIAPYIEHGHLISLESTSYPGTTEEVVQAIIEKETHLVAGKDFFLVFSPEREDPGNEKYNTKNIPKIVGGLTESCLTAGKAMYSAALEQVIPVSSLKVAEMTKILENTYRLVNIALINELKTTCSKLGIDIWEVIKAASTKPFGFQPFYPSAGCGGHCIPIDPFYLTWKARQVDTQTKFIELAGEIITNMPYTVVDKVKDALNLRRKSLNGASILIIGVAYKPNIDDLRESPALKIIKSLKEQGATVLYHDPHIPKIRAMHGFDFEMLIITNHKEINYELISKNADLIIDTRNSIPKASNVIPA
jgi:UDP-N-acetyl-D-glucosamine dehydrogenase